MELNININEIAALIISVSIGTAGYTAFLRLVKKENTNLASMIWLFMLNLLVAHSFSELMKYYNMGEARAAFLPIISFMGLYILIWFDKRYLKIFDAGLKKTTGLDIEDRNNKDDNTENINTDETETEQN